MKRAYRKAHLKEAAEYQRKYRAEHPGHNASMQRRAYVNHREERVQKARRNRRELKMKVLGHYGGQCDCCGEVRLEFLTIDHINGGGTEHRRSTGLSADGFYRWIVREDYPDILRVLCFNCNCALGMFGYCPHKEGTRL